MTARLLSIVQAGPKAGAERARRGDESAREQLLFQKLLAFPVAPRGEPRTADSHLVHVASVLLKSELTIAGAFGWESCSSPLQRLVFLVYVGEGEGDDIPLRSLSDNSILGPASVALRWVAKLLADGIFELAAGPDPGNPLVRLTSDAASMLEQLLSNIYSELGAGKQRGFSV